MENKNESKTSKNKKIRHIIVEYLTIAVLTIIGITFLYTQILYNGYIPSESMESTLMVGDRIIGNRLAYKFGNSPERFDVVIFYAPDEDNLQYVKRIIGMPGEKVTIDKGKIYINDSSSPLDDSFIPEKMEFEEKMEFQVPQNSYFMLGDNRNESFDSRYWENPFVSADDIIAKVIFKFWKGFEIIS